MKTPFKKVVSTACVTALLLSAAPLPAVWATDATSAVSATGTGSSQAALQDGTYTINYMMIKFGTNQKSVMHDYVVTPGTLTVVQGEQYLTMTLKQSNETPVFKTELNGVLKDVEVISKNEKENTREVRFEVQDLSRKLKAWVKVEWAEINYFHEYDVEISIDKDSVKKISGSTEQANPGASAPKDQPKAPEPAGQPPVAAPKSSLSDIQNHWAKGAIEEAIALGIANGYEDGTFNPDGEISRSEFAVLVSRALKLEGNGEELKYVDLNSIPDWAKASLEQAVGAGIISSYEDNTFRPDRKITRAEIAVMIVRAMGLQTDANDKLSFADGEQIPGWAYQQVAAAFKKGIISGRSNNQFAPNASATRAEAVTLILSVVKDR